MKYTINMSLRGAIHRPNRYYVRAFYPYVKIGKHTRLAKLLEKYEGRDRNQRPGKYFVLEYIKSRLSGRPDTSVTIKDRILFHEIYYEIVKRKYELPD